MSLFSVLEERFKAHPGSAGWVLEVTPPLPESWPQQTLVYYAFAHRFRPTLIDGQEVAAPWAKADERGNVTLLTDSVTLLGTEGIRPLTGGEILLLKEVQQAGSLEELWRRAAHHAPIAMLLRRWYCHWSNVRSVSRHVLARHPELAAFLDCAHVTIAIEPVRPPAPDSLIWPEFLRRYGKGNGVWQHRTTPPLPASWPASRDTAFAYYVWSIRVFQADEVPKRRETSEPWGIVVRAGVGGALAFSSLHELPPSLGVQPGRRPAEGHIKLMGELGEMDEALVRAGQDHAVAELVRRYYQEWISSEPLLAPLVLARHPEFAAFLDHSSTQ